MYAFIVAEKARVRGKEVRCQCNGRVLGSLSTREYYLKGHRCDRVVPVTRPTPANMKVIPVIFFIH